MLRQIFNPSSFSSFFQKVKSNKEACQKLASRVQEILDKIAAAVPDATCIPSDLVARIDQFTRYISMKYGRFTLLTIISQDLG